MKEYKNKSYLSIKNNGGITLIALVITIIILIILAGVSIATINKSSMFNKAKYSTKEYQNAEKEEKNTLNEYEQAISNESQNIDTSVADKLDTWLLLANIANAKQYSQEQILSNDELLNKLMNSDEAIDYMMKSKQTIMPAVISSEKAMKSIQNSLKAKQKLIKDSDWKTSFENHNVLPTFDGTSNTKDGVTIEASDDASNYGSMYPYCAVDGNKNSGWASASGNYNPHYFVTTFDVPTIVTNYYLYGATGWDSHIYKFQLQASNDGKQWNSLEGDTIHIGLSSYSPKEWNFNIDNTTPYNYYRVYFPEGGWTYGTSGGCPIHELKLYGI